MAALSSITAVRPTSTTKTKQGLYGATISAGQCVYLDGADNKYKLADCNGASASVAAVVGIAMTPGIDGGYGLVAIDGEIVLVGATVAIGTTYFVGQTAGSIVPHADLTTSDYVSRIGTGSTASNILLSLSATGIVHA